MDTDLHKDLVTEMILDMDVSVTSPEVVSIDAEKPVSRDYVFPPDIELQAKKLITLVSGDSNKLLEPITRLSYDKSVKTGERFGFLEVRNKLLILGIALNLIGVIAPRFRPMRTPPKIKPGTDYSTENILLSNDRQVIDLHWIHCKRMRVSIIKGYQKLFDPYTPFDWIRASEFVSKAGAFKRKADLLSLSEIDEIQLAAICTQSTKTRYKTIQGLVDKNTIKIRDLTSDPKCKMAEDIKWHLPLIYEALLIGRGSPSKAVLAYKFKTGIDIPSKNISRYAQTLKEAGILSL